MRQYRGRCRYLLADIMHWYVSGLQYGMKVQANLARSSHVLYGDCATCRVEAEGAISMYESIPKM
jgi:hypothetical protein